MTLIPPYDHPDVIAGQGTAAKELFDEGGPARRAVRLPRRRRAAVRLGALGARARAALQDLRASSPRPATTASSRSARAGSCISTRPRRSRTARRRSIWAPTRSRSSGATSTTVLTASDTQLVDCMRFFASRMKLVVEPTGCLGFAAARQMKAQWPANASASSSAAATSIWNASAHCSRSVRTADATLGRRRTERGHGPV